MYKIYTITNIEHIDFSVFEPFLQYLPTERQAKILRLQRSTDRKNCALSYFLLQYGMYINHGIRSFALSYGRNGKPYLSDYPHIHFSISHCNYGCICTISDNPIGIDIQDIRPFSWSVSEHCCSMAELQLIKESVEPAAEFTKIWTMKESYLKMKGTGITVDLLSVDTTKLQNRIKTFKMNGCYISVASAEQFREEPICLI